jgi:hypothetical protein
VVFADGAALPPNQTYASGPSIHYPLGRFDDIVGILRQDSPLYLLLSLDNQIGSLATSGLEPTGEAEP